MSLEGEKLAARFSHNCWKIRMKKLCNLLKDFAKNDLEHEKVVRVLKKLDSFSWYEIIASQNNIDDPFDLGVVKAYWMGDDKLLKRIESNNQVLLPFHNYTVFDHLDYSTLKEIDSCKISVARVCRAKKSFIEIYHTAITKKENKIFLAKPKLDSINYGFLDNVVNREWIIYHEGEGIQKIEEEEAIKLINRTKDAIKLFNEQTTIKSRE